MVYEVQQLGLPLFTKFDSVVTKMTKKRALLSPEGKEDGKCVEPSGMMRCPPHFAMQPYRRMNTRLHPSEPGHGARNGA